MTENLESLTIKALGGLQAVTRESGNVVMMADHIARLRDLGKIHRRGFFFTYIPEGAQVIDLATHRRERAGCCW